MKRLNSGDAVLKGITFSDGTIKFDVNTIGRGVPGIAFRQQDEGNLQLFYLKPDPSCPALQACIQYDPRLMGSYCGTSFRNIKRELRKNGDKNT